MIEIMFDFVNVKGIHTKRDSLATYMNKKNIQTATVLLN